MNGNSHRNAPTALVRAVVKLESAPVPLADTTSDPICYCPECGARLRAIANEALQALDSSVANKTSRTTLVNWVPGANPLPTLAPVVDEDDEPTKVVRSALDLAIAAIPKIDRPNAPRKPPVPVRQKLPSEDDDEYTTRMPRVEDLKLRPGPSVDANESLQSTPPSLAVGETMGAIASALPAVEQTNRKEVVVSLSPTTVEPRDTDRYPQYSAQAARRRVTVLFPIFGLGLGIAVAGGLAFLVYGNTTSIARGKPTVALPAVEERSSATIAAQITSPTAMPTASTPTALPAASVAVAEPAIAEDSKRGTKSSTTSSAMRRKATDTTQGSDTARATETSEGAAANAAAAAEEASDGPTFDSEAAAGALESAAQRASTCRQPSDPSGVARVTVTFAPSGRVTTASIAGPPFVGTPTGSCIATIMRSASVPPFSGSSITVRKTVTIL